MKNQTPFTPQEHDELVDLCIHLGQRCWNTYCHSKTGFIRIFMLPSDIVRHRANELFQLGFGARLLMCPPSLDSVIDSPDEVMWECYLRSMVGKTVLDGAAYPDTAKIILDCAKEFFLEGFRAGTIAVRELFES